MHQRVILIPSGEHNFKILISQRVVDGRKTILPVPNLQMVEGKVASRIDVRND